MHFHTCCILDMLHFDGFSCIQKVRFVLMHSPRSCSCTSCIFAHSKYGAFICIIVHLYASPHKVHSVDTLHSDTLAFLRIQAHIHGALHST